MKSRMNKLMSLCLVAMMGTTLIPQPIQAEEVSEFEEATVEYEEATFEEEKNQVAESNSEKTYTETFDYRDLKYGVTDPNAKTVEVIGFADGYYPTEPTGYRLWITETVSKQDESDKEYTVTSIGKSAFAGCSSIEDIQFPDSLKIIGKSAFESCTNLLGVPQWSENLKTIGESAFKNCWQLSYVHLPKGLETIKRSAFERCVKLTDVNLSKGLKTIEDSAFKDCNNLGYIYLPEGLETIGESAFDLLPNEFYDPCLSRINIPSTVKELNYIFGKNSDDHTVTSPFKENSALFFHGDGLPIINSDFFNLLSSGKNKPIIYFPEDAMETYAGEKSPFVEAGLINPKLFDSYYEFIQLCPKNGLNDSVSIPRLDTISSMLDLDYDRNILDCSTHYPLSISSKGITGETIFSYKVSVMAEDEQKKLISEASKIKFKVAHRYVWVVDKEPTKDEPGSKYQYCVKCEDAKEPVTIPPTGGGSGGGSTGGSTSGGSGGGSSTGGGSTIDPNAPTQQVENAVYRAYNPYNGEHLYTTNYGEFKVITKNGWNDEGIAFMSELKEKGQAVYRVYNPNSGLHHYTTNVNEKNALVSLGWNDEGVAFYTSKNPKDTPVYRVYNGNDGNHHYTKNANEALALISMGWKNEGIAFLTAPMK